MNSCIILYRDGNDHVQAVQDENGLKEFDDRDDAILYGEHNLLLKSSWQLVELDEL